MIKQLINWFSRPNESESSIYVRYLNNRYKLFFQSIGMYILIQLFGKHILNDVINTLIFLIILFVIFCINCINSVLDYKEMSKPNNTKSMIISYIKLISELTLILMITKCIYYMTFKYLFNSLYLIYLIPIVGPYLISDMIPIIIKLINKINSTLMKIFNKV